MEPLRIVEARAIAWSDEREAPSAETLAARVRAGGSRRVPIGLALSGGDLPAAIAAAADAVDFFSVPLGAALAPGALACLRAATPRPLLVRLPADAPPEVLVPLVDAGQRGIDGCIACTGERTELLRAGQLEGPFLRDRALAQVRGVRRHFGDRCPVIAAGGIESPADALAFVAAGAKLVQVAAGFVYAGPGLPARITRAVLDGEPDAAPEPAPRGAPPPTGTSWGPRLVALTGWILAASGLALIALAATVQLLPPDIRYLGMTVRQLCDRHACRIVHFMAHDRVSFGGSILAIGVVYHWLAAGPLRRGEAWAFWALLFSGLIGFGSFLTYLGYGYFDVWHGLATLALLPIFVVGLAASWRGLRGSRHVRCLLRPGARAWRWSPGHLGRVGVGFAAFGMIAGGTTIMAVGMTQVFVATDLAFIGASVAELDALNPRLVSLIAHDRAGFGGGLCSGGIAIMAALWCGARPGAKELWWVLLVAGLVGFGTAIGVHPVVGYLSFIHLLPAYLGAGAFLLGMAKLHRDLCRAPDASRFPDL